jgi:hypothetical protein
MKIVPACLNPHSMNHPHKLRNPHNFRSETWFRYSKPDGIRPKIGK